MRPEIVDGRGVIALDPRERVILYLDNDKEEAEAKTPLEMAKILSIPPASLYSLIDKMGDEGLVHIAETVKVRVGKNRHPIHIYALTEDGQRLAKMLHHIRMVRF